MQVLYDSQSAFVNLVDLDASLLPLLLALLGPFNLALGIRKL